MEVQSMGENDGWRVAILAVQPDWTRRATLGILPTFMSGRMTFQSAASQPMRRTFLRGVSGSGIAAFDGGNAVCAQRQQCQSVVARMEWQSARWGRSFVGCTGGIPFV